MATLSGKTTSGQLAFTKYVTDNPRYSEIEYEIEKGAEANLLIKSGTKVKLDVKLKAGDTFNILEKKTTEVDDITCAKVKFKSKVGYIPISKIRKPTTGGSSTQYEDQVVDALNKSFLEIGQPITIQLGGRQYKNLMYAVKLDTSLKQRAGVRADPKCDIIICEDIKNPFAGTPIYISHKKEGGPEVFQQYGGLSEVAGSEIYNHPAVQKFLRFVSQHIKNDKLEAPIMGIFDDARLANLSIFGPEYGKKFSVQHVQLIGQGQPILTKINEDTFKLDFTSHMSLSGDLSHFGGGYTPVFGATFRAGRGFEVDGKRISGARVGIYPKKLVESRGGLIEFKA